MALLQISEPGMSAHPHECKRAVGIDLGTTNSLVATVRNGIPETLPDENGNHLLPSVVRYVVNSNPLVGAAAQLQALDDPLNTITSVKRLMGRSVQDLKTLEGYLPYEFEKTDSAVPRITTADGPKSAIEVSAAILGELRQRAEQTLGGQLHGAVITVPAYFDDAQRQATKDAAKLAGLHVYRLLNEPTAAAVAYGLDRKQEGTIAIFDLGGGTFDISILQLRKGIFEVLATGGDTALGGDDFDREIAKWMLQQVGIDKLTDHKLARQILTEARRAKEQLSSQEDARLQLIFNKNEKRQAILNRLTFEELVEHLIKKILSCCRATLRNVNMTTDRIDNVVMVGGATRMPCVRKTAEQFFGKPPLLDLDPDRVVAIGAAIQADILAGNKPDAEMLLIDVVPLSLGVEIMGELVEKVIDRNTPIPIAKAKEFTTFKDGQTAMRIHVVQGEREIVSHCRSLARFDLKGIPPMVAGAARVVVTFQVDADGLLSVTAQEKTSGVASQIEVKPSYGLTDNEIEKMLTESFSYAKEDMSLRMLREQQVEADRVIEALDSALMIDGDALLSTEERARILKAREHLVELRNHEDPTLIKEQIKKLESVTEPYIARRMNSAVGRAMAGHKIEEFEN